MNTGQIGVNLVHPEMDEEEFYTRDGYFQVLEQYRRYAGMIHCLEYSHVVNLSPEDAELVGKTLPGVWISSMEHSFRTSERGNWSGAVSQDAET